MMTPNARVNGCNRGWTPGPAIALLFIGMLVALGASASQDAQRMSRLELVDAQGRIAAVLDVSTAGRPRVSVIGEGAATVFEFSTDAIQIVTPVPDAAEGAPQVRVSTLPLDVLHALAGMPAGEDVSTDAVDSIALRMQYIQEQVDRLREDHRALERRHEQDTPRGRDTGDPLRLQRVIDDLQREVRDLENNLTRAERDISDLKRRIR